MPEPTHPYPDDLQRAFALLARLEAQNDGAGMRQPKFNHMEYDLLLTLVRFGTAAMGRKWLGGDAMKIGDPYTAPDGAQGTVVAIRSPYSVLVEFKDRTQKVVYDEDLEVGVW